MPSGERDFSLFIKITLVGFPSPKDVAPYFIWPYWSLRDILTFKDAILHSEALLTLPGVHDMMLTECYKGHMSTTN